jgi:pyruvate, water dikinase
MRGYATVPHIFDERNAAVMAMVKMAIATVKANGRKIGICGQAPSDYPPIRSFSEQGIDSIGLNPDSAIETRLEIAQVEASM